MAAQELPEPPPNSVQSRQLTGTADTPRAGQGADRACGRGRVKSIDEIPLVRTHGAMTREAKLECIVARLQQMKTAKPRTVRTLGSTIAALFQKQREAKEIESLFKALEKRELISIEGNKIGYSLPVP
jgi:hypothetical protein